MHIYTYPKERFETEGVVKNDVLKLIQQHISYDRRRVQQGLDYYEGKAKIFQRKMRDGLPNSQVGCNHAKDITDTATGYFMAASITYNVASEQEANLDKLTDAFDQANVDEVDHDNALDMSRCGVAYEYVYVKENETTLRSKNLSPTNTFIVYDDSIEQEPLFGIYYFKRTDDTNKSSKYQVVLCTKEEIYTMTILDNTKKRQKIKQLPLEEPVPHFFGDIPIIEYCNNKDGVGDFEGQISLIDAYDTVMSDRVNDKVKFIDSILVLYGVLLGDDEEETSEALKVLKKDKLLELPVDARAEYIARTFDEAGMEILRKAIKEDIYSLSHVPNMSDENFAGNSTGVAMEYKLLGLNMITNTKERYYTKGLKKRITLFANYLKLKAIAINPAAIIPTYKRKLPKNFLELSQIINNLSGKVSQETLISQLDFVEDPQGEIERVELEKENDVKRQREMFSVHENTPPEDKVEDEEKS